MAAKKPTYNFLENFVLPSVANVVYIIMVTNKPWDRSLDPSFVRVTGSRFFVWLYLKSSTPLPLFVMLT